MSDESNQNTGGGNEAAEIVGKDVQAGKDLTAEEIFNAEISESLGATTNVGRIENIEKVEITGDKLNRFLSYFPHLLVGLISLVALAGLVYIVWISNKQGANSTEAARSLITYLVAVITIVIALILTLMAFFSTLPDLKERFALGKEVLTILIGVLGTIVGFYYGSAPKETATPTVTPSPTATVSPTPASPPAANIPVFNTRRQLVAKLEMKNLNLAQTIEKEK